MSRLRAKDANKTKYAEVNVDDVEAAINVLKMRPNSHEFWVRCAKRCAFHVVNDCEDRESVMTYDEVEQALQQEETRGPRSRSVSRQRQSRASSQTSTTIWNLDFSPSESDSRDLESDPEAEYESTPNSDEEYISSPPLGNSSPSSPFAGSLKKRIPDSIEVQESAERALDAHTEEFDMYASQTEEIRLWHLLKQTPPFEFSLQPVTQGPNTPRDGLAERENWRARVGYLGEWETMNDPAPEVISIRNEKRMAKLARRRGAAQTEYRPGVVANSEDVDEELEDQVNRETDMQEISAHFGEKHETEAKRQTDVESPQADRPREDAFTDHQALSSNDGYQSLESE